MVRIIRGPAAALLAVLVLATGAGAASGDCRLIRGATTPDPVDDVKVCEQATYFHRNDALHVFFGDVGVSVANTGSTIPSWDATAPTTPTSDSAAYAAVLGRLVATDSQVRPTFQGAFTGNIDTLRVDAFLTVPVYQATGGGYPLIFDLAIDGNVLINESPAAGSEQAVPMMATSEDGVSKISFAVKNLHSVMESNGLDLGDDVQHTVRVSMAGLYYGDTNGVYWFDSASRPSGIYFNPNKPTGVVYDASNYA